MVLRKSIVVFLLVFSVISTSCLEVVKEISDWTQIDDINEIDGELHYLGDDGIKLFLPTTFKRYTTLNYLNLLDSLVVDEKQMEIERSRVKFMRELEGNHYIFFDNTVNATYTLNAVSYMPISRQDAKYILGMIRQNQNEISSKTDLEYEKITAKHSNNGRTQIFKAIFKVTNSKLQQQAFQHAYFISSNEKTVLIYLMAPFEINFDPFLEKMIL
ncbi:hypothetical protein [Winogradskyella sp.]|uniref:hypothetical protein n=1 Tax=Winogradskyella sp. TaxID=1883156 RepID=UPI00351804B1